MRLCSLRGFLVVVDGTAVVVMGVVINWPVDGVVEGGVVMTKGVASTLSGAVSVLLATESSGVNSDIWLLLSGAPKSGS